MPASFQKKIKFSEPGNYRLQILGRVNPDLWNSFEGRIDAITSDNEGEVTTTLSLNVRDQVELSGFINMIHDRRLVLLSIKMT